MRQFMAYDIYGYCEAVEEITISITIDHLPSVPEGVVVIRIKVDC